MPQHNLLSLQLCPPARNTQPLLLQPGLHQGQQREAAQGWLQQGVRAAGAPQQQGAVQGLGKGLPRRPSSSL